jgi:hypothetical protein
VQVISGVNPFLRAEICVNGSRFRVGYFKQIEDAAKAIAEKRIELHGAFANHG